MNKTLVIGAGGKVGQILISLLSSANHPTVAMLRDPTKVNFADNIEVVQGDLEGEFVHAMRGCDTVIFTAGSGGHTGADKTLLVDLWGAAKAIEAAKSAGVKHFIMISARGADNPDLGPVAIKPYSVAKFFADQYLIASGLPYTILRPGRLTDEAATSLIKTERPDDPKRQFISREDTAKVIWHCIDNSQVIGNIYELYQGGSSVDELVC